MLRRLFALLLAAGPLAAGAATCTWNAASGNWSLPANWTGCADAPGPSTRSPGAGDIAVLANGTANLDASPSVAQFELGTGGLLSVVGGTKTFDISGALRLKGGKATTILGTNQLLLYLHAGASGSLLASTTLENAVFFENSGTLALGSASGVALTLICCAEVRNMPGGTITLSGGNSRLYLAAGSKLVNNAGATLTISGNTTIGRPDATAASSYLLNQGTMIVNGPGTLNMPMGVGTFQQYGDLTVNNATIFCSYAAANPDKCSYQDNNGGAIPTGSITRLNNATLDLGGPGMNYNLFAGSTITGQGTINKDVTVRGTLAPGALSGKPYGTLTITGKLDIQATATLDFDIGGGAAASHDALHVAGQVQDGTNFTPEGYGRLVLRLAAGYAPTYGASVPVISYASVASDAALNRIDANHALDYAARFDSTVLQVFPAPRVTLDSPSVVEGASGTTPLTFHLHLSHASALMVSVQLQSHDGTAVNGLSPSGDYLFATDNVFSFAPGETLKTTTYPVNGDSVVEGNEAFSLEIVRSKLTNAAIGNGIPGNPSAVGTILTDDLPANTRFVLVGKDNGSIGAKIRRYTTTGTFVDAWGPDTGNYQGYIATGMCFSPAGDVLTTRFTYPNPIYYSRFGAVLNAEFGNPNNAAVFNNHESCVFDLAGNVYIGQAGGSGSTDAQVPVKKFDRYGTLLETIVLPTGPRGTDWIDLAGDQCTLYYTSEDTSVRRYNVCTHTALPVFASGLTGPYCYALRLRPNRELMVACQDAVHRLSSQGVNLHTYTRASIGETDVNGLFAMNLDPDGTSFWTAGILSGNVYHVDIASGTVLGSFNSGQGGVAGLAVYNELHDDVIFADGFESQPAAALVFGAQTAAAEEETEFWPDVRDMPPYVPRWMSVVPRESRARQR